MSEYFIRDIRKELEEKYKEELKNYSYISKVEDFANLTLKGSIRYINRRTRELKYGGLLTKIYQDKNKHWMCVIIKPDKTKYYVSYNNNFMYYIKSSQDRFDDWTSVFMTNVDKGLYDIV